VRVEAFDQDLHAWAMRVLFESRALGEQELTRTGFIAFDEQDEPVAAAFLRQIEGGMGLFDGLISNGHMTADLRDAGLDAVVLALIARARELNITRIMAFSEDEGTLKRSLRHGFVHLKHTTIALKL